MSLPNIFSAEVSNQIIERIHKLSPQTQALWGKMNVAQMLAHCNVTYEMVYDHIHPKPNVFVRILLKAFVKPKVVSETPYTKGGPTAPQFVIKDDKTFETEKLRLVQYIQKTHELGAQAFEGRESHSFGKLTQQEWNNMFYKHLDHHLSQFGV